MENTHEAMGLAAMNPVMGISSNHGSFLVNVMNHDKDLETGWKDYTGVASSLDMDDNLYGVDDHGKIMASHKYDVMKRKDVVEVYEIKTKDADQVLESIIKEASLPYDKKPVHSKSYIYEAFTHKDLLTEDQYEYEPLLEKVELKKMSSVISGEADNIKKQWDTMNNRDEKTAGYIPDNDYPQGTENIGNTGMLLASCDLSLKYLREASKNKFTVNESSVPLFFSEDDKCYNVLDESTNSNRLEKLANYVNTIKEVPKQDDTTFKWPEDIKKNKQGNCIDVALLVHYYCNKKDINNKLVRITLSYHNNKTSSDISHQSHIICACYDCDSWFIIQNSGLDNNLKSLFSINSKSLNKTIEKFASIYIPTLSNYLIAEKPNMVIDEIYYSILDNKDLESFDKKYYGENRSDKQKIISNLFSKTTNIPINEDAPINNTINRSFLSSFVKLLNNTFRYEERNDNYAGYRTKSPLEFEKTKCGVCWDYAEYEASVLRKHIRPVTSKLTNNTFSMYYHQYDDKKKCPTHTWVACMIDNKVYVVESSWYSNRGLHTFSSEDDMIKNYCSKLNRGKYPNLLVKYMPSTKFGLNAVDYMTDKYDRGTVIIDNVGVKEDATLLNEEDDDEGEPEVSKSAPTTPLRSLMKQLDKGEPIDSPVNVQDTDHYKSIIVFNTLPDYERKFCYPDAGEEYVAKHLEYSSILERDKHPVAVGCLYKIYTVHNTGYIVLMVDPKYRTDDIIKELISNLVEQCRIKNMTRMECSVPRDNEYWDTVLIKNGFHRAIYKLKDESVYEKYIHSNKSIRESIGMDTLFANMVLNK